MQQQCIIIGEGEYYTVDVPVPAEDAALSLFLRLSLSEKLLFKHKKAVFSQDDISYLAGLLHVKTIRKTCHLSGIDENRDIYVARLQMGCVGGKGGFGALLRGGPRGVEIKKTTNFGMCRDLSGRRLKHVENEKKLAEWRARKEKERLEKEAKKKEKKEKPVKRQREDEVEVQNQIRESAVKTAEAISVGLQSTVANGKQENGKRAKKEQPIEAIEQLWDPLGLEDDSDEESEHEGKQEKQETEEQFEHKQESEEKLEKREDDIKVDNDEVREKQNGVYEEISSNGHSSTVEFNLEECNSIQEIEKYGLELLKRELELRGLKCGGTLTQRAERLWQCRGKSQNEIDPSLLAGTKPHKKIKRKE